MMNAVIKWVVIHLDVEFIKAGSPYWTSKVGNATTTVPAANFWKDNKQHTIFFCETSCVVTNTKSIIAKLCYADPEFFKKLVDMRYQTPQERPL